MQKLKRLLALIGAILLIVLYVSTLIFSLMNSELAHGLLKASIFCTIAVPVILYACMLAYRVLRGRGVPNPPQKDTTKEPDNAPTHPSQKDK